MRFEETRRQVADTAREMLRRGLTHGTSGNVSARLDGGLVAVTPTGLDYEGLAPGDITVVDLAGTIVDGDRRPTSEIPMHLEVYRGRADVAAIVHTHSDMATTLAVLGEDLPAVHYVLGWAGTRVRCAPYATYGTPELAQAAVDALEADNAVLLGNHGLLAVGRTLPAALNVAESVEVVAGLYYRARLLGAPRILDDVEMGRVRAALAAYGQPVGDAESRPGRPPRVHELRLVVTAEDYDRALRLYRDVLGLPEEAAFTSPSGRVAILSAGRATLELADRGHAAYVDEVEVGRRVAGHVRVAFGVDDSRELTDELVAAGATLIAEPTLTPWQSLNSRLDGPAGLQLTLFTEMDRSTPDPSGA